MDKIWVETLGRISELEKRVNFIFENFVQGQRMEPEPTMESQKDAVDLPKQEPKPVINIDLDMAGNVITPEPELKTE